CEEVVREMHLEATAPCDASCADSIDLAAANRLTAEIDRRARELRARGAKAILVDVTRNGGGSNWVEAPPRILSRVPLSEPRLAFLRHPHWTPQLEQKLRDVEADLQGPLGRLGISLHEGGQTRARSPSGAGEVRSRRSGDRRAL